MFTLLKEADSKANISNSSTTVFNVLCEAYDIKPTTLHESMHLLTTKAIDLLNRLDKNDYTAAEEISRLPFYALAATMVGADQMGALNTFRKEVGDKRPLADFINDKSIVQAPSDPRGESAFSTVGILSNFAKEHATSAIDKIKNAFEASKKDPLVRAELTKRLRNTLNKIDGIYSKAVGDKEKTAQTQQPQQPQRVQRTV